MNQPLVSIITPSYNQVAFIEETILSVLNQTYKNIEYIIIDGASQDGSVDIIKKYEHKIKYWVSESDKGQASAINKGFMRATGKYCCWLNSDDLIYPTFIETAVNFLENNQDVDFVYGDVEQGVDLNSKELRAGKKVSFVNMLISLEIPIPQMATLWKRELFKKIGYLDERWHVLLDRDFFLRVVKNVSVVYINQTFGFFRHQRDSKSVSHISKWLEELPLFYTQYFKKQENQDLIKYKKHTMVSMWLECYWIAKDNKLGKALIFKKNALKESYYYFLIDFFLKRIIRKIQKWTIKQI